MLPAPAPVLVDVGGGLEDVDGQLFGEDLPGLGVDPLVPLGAEFYEAR